MEKPKVSICIPSYNGEPYIREAIESALFQSYNDFELLIVDDASTDNTVSIVKEYNDKRIVIVCNEANIGLVNNWNKCLKLSRGEYIQFLFQDDLLTNDCIEKKINAFNIDSRIGLTFSASNIINEKSNLLHTRKYFRNDMYLIGSLLAKKSFIYKNYFGEPSNVMFKRELVDIIGEFNSKLCYLVDLEYWIRICNHRDAYYICDCLMSFRVSHSSMTSKLIKNTRFMNFEDKTFIEVILNEKLIELSNFEKFLHKFFFYTRNIIRYIFQKITVFCSKFLR